MGYINGNSNIANKLRELVTLASSYDESGVYQAKENGILFKEIIKTNVMGVSWLNCIGSKDDRVKKCSRGFKYSEVTFAMLADMLKQDIAYTPFEFKDGIRSDSNITGSIKWLAIDIDKSLFTDEEMHEILKEFNHHIVRTSDKTNPYKFRLLLELDAPISLDKEQYRIFLTSICDYLSITADIVPRSQIYFSYKGRNILSVTNKQTIETRDHLLITYDSANKTTYIPESSKEKKALLSDKLGTFNYAFEAKNGEGSFSLIRAAKHAKDLGMNKDEVINLMNEINSFWRVPMDEIRFQNTIINQIKNWEF